MTVRKVHFHVNSGKPEAKSAYEALAARLSEFGMEPCAKGADADVVVALGGDGTILRAARLHREKPIAGFNFGGLGYLASVERRDFDKALSMLADGGFRISRRTMLEARRPGDAAPAAVALNDIVLMRELSGHAAMLDLAVDGRGVARYFADGLVFATPTGSTAYSLAAGGPVLMPDSASFVVTPMNPHALGVRPMVVSDGVSLAATPRARDGERGGKIGVYADGDNALMLDDGETIEIRKSPECASFVEFQGYDPYEVLARKLGWSGTMV
jgi:NAD+ kinase